MNLKSDKNISCVPDKLRDQDRERGWMRMNRGGGGARENGGTDDSLRRKKVNASHHRFLGSGPRKLGQDARVQVESHTSPRRGQQVRIWRSWVTTTSKDTRLPGTCDSCVTVNERLSGLHLDFFILNCKKDWPNVLSKTRQ